MIIAFDTSRAEQASIKAGFYGSQLCQNQSRIRVTRRSCPLGPRTNTRPSSQTPIDSSPHPLGFSLTGCPSFTPVPQPQPYTRPHARSVKKMFAKSTSRVALVAGFVFCSDFRNGKNKRTEKLPSRCRIDILHLKNFFHDRMWTANNLRNQTYVRLVQNSLECDWTQFFLIIVI